MSNVTTARQIAKNVQDGYTGAYTLGIGSTNTANQVVLNTTLKIGVVTDWIILQSYSLQLSR